MKKIYSLVLVMAMLFAISGCAKKTASEQLSDDMKKMQGDMNQAAKKMQNDLK